MAAVRGADGQVMLLAWHRDRLSAKLAAQPRRRDVGAGDGARHGQRRGVACDEVGCVVEIEGRASASPTRSRPRSRIAGRLDLVIARAGPEFCKGGRMIGPRALRASGGIAVKGRDGRLEVETVRRKPRRLAMDANDTGFQTYKLNLVE